MLVVFCSAAAYEAVHLSSLADTDVWWHLSTGLWILRHHGVPHFGIFSQYSNLPWIASSWGYDVWLALAYKLIGLRAVPVTLMLSQAALAALAFLLARRGGGGFPLALLLSVVFQCSFADLQLLPKLCSLVCFAIELALLFESRRGGKVRILYWLPPLFVLWADLHLQFVLGLIVLLLLLAATMAEQVAGRFGTPWFKSGLPLLPSGKVAAVTVACFIATLLSPYTYHTYELVIHNAAPLVFIPEEHAMDFRHAQNYVLLLLAMAAFFALGRRRSRDLFKLALMIAGSMLAFRIRGDGGFLAIASVAVIAEAFFFGQTETEHETPGDWEIPATVLLAAIALVAAGFVMPANQKLLDRVEENFPVRACDYIRENHLPAPLFNEYRWGGFLTFYLPDYPVVIDGRTNLYGEELISRYFRLTNAEVPLNADPTFAAAQTILLPANSAMAIALVKFSDFKTVYGDTVATVLVRQN